MDGGKKMLLVIEAYGKVMLVVTFENDERMKLLLTLALRSRTT